MRRILVALSLALLFLSLISAFAIDLQTLPLTVTAAVVAVGLLNLMSTPFRSVPPDGWVTFGDITRKLVGSRIATRMLHLSHEDEILNELRPLLVETLAVDEDEIVPSARFIEDLGVN